MSATASAPTHYILRDVNLFASGKYRGRTWLPRWITNMAVQGKKLGPSGLKLHTPPSAPGHEDDEGWREHVATDEPAAGWVDPDSLRTVPDPEHPGHVILKGNVVNVPAVMAQAIRDGKYRYGSAEIYDSFLDDFGRKYGKVLRKFSYLGGEVPQVKRLGPLPMPEPMAAPKKFSERAGVAVRERVVRRHGFLFTYAEIPGMDRQNMLAAAKAAMPGLSQATLDALTDEQLADLVKNLPAAPADPAAAMPGGMPPAAPGGMFADASREEMIAALVDAGEDADELEGMTDDEIGALYDELEPEDEPAPAEPADQPATDMGGMGGGTNYDMADPAAMTREELIAELVAEGQDAAALDAMTDEELQGLYAQLTGAAPAAAPAPAPAAAMGERGRRRTKGHRSTMSETRTLARNARRLNDVVVGELRRMQVANAELKRQDAQTFCDRLVAEGRVTPALVKAAVLPSLLGLDNTRAVHRFAENGRTRNLTAYEARKRELAKLPVTVKFGERFPAGGAGDGRPDGAAEEAKVRQFAETLPDAALKAGGYKSRENFVQKFSEARKKNPELTAKEYLGN